MASIIDVFVATAAIAHESWLGCVCPTKNQADRAYLAFSGFNWFKKRQERQEFERNINNLFDLEKRTAETQVQLAINMVERISLKR